MTSHRELEVLLGPGAGEPEALLLIARPRPDGRIQVRGWTSNDWSRTPDVRQRDAADVLAEIEAAVRSGRSVRPELAVVREWLTSTTTQECGLRAAD